MLTTSLRSIRDYRPCVPDWKATLKYFGKTSVDDEQIPVESFYKAVGFDSTLWGFSSIEGYDTPIRLYCFYCADHVLPLFEALYPEDKRPRAAVEIAKRFCFGKATEKEMVSARIAAEASIREDEPIADAAAKAAASCCVLDIKTQIGTIAYCAKKAAFEALQPFDPEPEFLRLCRLEGEYGVFS